MDWFQTGSNTGILVETGSVFDKLCAVYSNSFAAVNEDHCLGMPIIMLVCQKTWQSSGYGITRMFLFKEVSLDLKPIGEFKWTSGVCFSLSSDCLYLDSSCWKLLYELLLLRLHKNKNKIKRHKEALYRINMFFLKVFY